MPLVIYDFFFMKEGFVQSLEIEIEDLEPRAEDCTRLIQNPLVIVKKMVIHIVRTVGRF